MNEKDKMAKALARAKATKKVLPYGSGANKKMPSAGNGMAKSLPRSRKNAGR